MIAWKDKRVLLTGGSRGIGPVIAREMARRGAHVALAARSAAQLEETAAAPRAFGTEVLVAPGDLTDAAQRAGLVERGMRAFGRVDVLVNNAGLEIEGAYVDLQWEAIRETIEVNLAAPLHVTRLV